MGVVSVAISCFIVMFACAFLAVRRDYHSGVFGTLFLLFIALGAFSHLDSIFEVTGLSITIVKHHASPASILVWAGAAGWFGRSVICYLRRLPGGNGWYACMLPQKRSGEAQVSM